MTVKEVPILHPVEPAQIADGEGVHCLDDCQAVTALQEEGHALGRPLVDTIKGSALSNLKELRPGSAGPTEALLLFVFDPDRQAVILVGGDKVGNWSGSYRVAVPQAEQAYAEHLKRIDIDGKDRAR